MASAAQPSSGAGGGAGAVHAGKDKTDAARRMHKLYRHVAATAGGGGLTAQATAVSYESELPDTGGSREARTMAKEREGAPFNVRQMTYFLDGSEEMTRCKELSAKQLEQEVCFQNKDFYDLTTEQIRKRTMEKVRAAYKLFVSDRGNDTMRKARLEVFTMYDPNWATRNGVNFGLFMGSLTSQGTPDQQQEYLPKMFLLELYGCMAMTELGHGSNVRGLETTATYLPDTDEFDLHSPTITATKWWIGAAGQTATHSAVYARLVINGEDKGVHCFLVQLRDVKTYRPMHGISIGDVGEKMGRNGIDNGWIRFDHVSKGGKYTKPPKRELGYGALLLGRASIVKESSDTLKMAATIGIRYSLVRRQGEPLGKGQMEPQIIEYRTLQSRLMPILASAYAFAFTGRFMMALHERLEQNLDESDLSILPDVHATSAGLKSFCSWYALNAIETLRHGCGGQGYCAYNGLSTLYANHAVLCTWEGDNYVMALQTARYLVSSLAKIKAGNKVQGSVEYLAQKLPSKWNVATAAHLGDTDRLIAALRFLSSSLVNAASEQLRATKARGGLSDKAAWNECSVGLFEASRAHCVYNIAKFFYDAVQERRAIEAKDAAKAKDNLAAPLTVLLNLFILSNIQAELGQYMTYGYMSGDQAKLVRAEVLELCSKQRSMAAPLIDAFAISDFLLNAPIGRHDGDVYGPLFEQVKRAPGALERAPYFESTIKPMLDGADHEWNNADDDSDDD